MPVTYKVRCSLRTKTEDAVHHEHCESSLSVGIFTDRSEAGRGLGTNTKYMKSFEWSHQVTLLIAGQSVGLRCRLTIHSVLCCQLQSLLQCFHCMFLFYTVIKQTTISFIFITTVFSGCVIVVELAFTVSLPQENATDSHLLNISVTSTSLPSRTWILGGSVTHWNQQP